MGAGVMLRESRGNGVKYRGKSRGNCVTIWEVKIFFESDTDFNFLNDRPVTSWLSGGSRQ